MSYYFGDQLMADTSVLVTQIENSLTSASAAGGPIPGLWTFVETFALTRGSTYTVRVWKCSGAVNDWGVDYYLALSYPTASPTTISWSLSESYDIANHKMINFAPLQAGAGLGNADGSYGPSTGALLSDTSTGPAFPTWFTSALNAQTDWYVSVTKRHLAVTVNSGTTPARGALLITGHTPFAGYTQAQMPTIFGHQMASGTSSNYATRAGTNPVIYQNANSYVVSLIRQGGYSQGVVTSGGLILDRFTQSAAGAPVLVASGDVASVPASGYAGGPRSLVPLAGMLTFNENSGLLARNGDRVTVGAKTYARFGSATATSSLNMPVTSVYIDESL